MGKLVYQTHLNFKQTEAHRNKKQFQKEKTYCDLYSDQIMGYVSLNSNKGLNLHYKKLLQGETINFMRLIKLLK